MKIRNKFLPILAISFLTACGGGGDSAFDGTPNARYNGSWGGDCVYDDFFEESELATLTVNGTRATLDFSSYPTSNCDGAAEDVAQAIYALDFVGTQEPTTGVCAVDDLLNAELISATINGVSFSADELSAMVDDGDGLAAYGLFCITPDGNTMYSYDESTGDGSSEENRPTSIDDTDSIMRVN